MKLLDKTTDSTLEAAVLAIVENYQGPEGWLQGYDHNTDEYMSEKLEKPDGQNHLAYIEWRRKEDLEQRRVRAILKDLIAAAVRERDEALGKLDACETELRIARESMDEVTFDIVDDEGNLCNKARVAKLEEALRDCTNHLARLEHQRKCANCDCGNPGHRDHRDDCALVATVEAARAALKGGS